MAQARVRPRNNFEVDFKYKDSATTVLDQMQMLLDYVGVVTVGNLHDLVNVKVEHGEDEVGWTKLEGIRILSRGESYTLVLPRPETLKNPN